ncbi:MAG: carbohydrate ABC transporter substrate-binding protein [Oscillospiraceae bacterium]|nr:carbohydrate ABC transporter substrate-binding protein [Oscillospiraceae bacterium]
MKKLFAILMAAMLTAVIFAGCGGSAPEAPAPAPAAPAESAPEAPAAPAEAETQELNLAIFEGGFGPAFWNEVVNTFGAEHPEITVNLQISPNIGDVIRPNIVAGNPPDFWNGTDNDQTGILEALIRDRGLLDLTDVFNGPQYDSDAPLRDKIIDGALESLKCSPYGDGRVYIAPGGVYPMALVYNTALFAEQGWDLPVTWDDFFALGDKAKELDIALFTYQGQYPGYWDGVLPSALASALGSDYAKIENLEPGIWMDPRTVAVMEQFEKIYTGGYLMPGTVGLNHTDSQAAQMMNRALFIPNGPWMEDEMKDAERAPGYRFGLAPSPAMSQGAPRYVNTGLGQFSIPAAAANPEAAKLFLRYLYTDEMIAKYAELNSEVAATKNAGELARPFLTEDIYGFFNVFSLPGAANINIGFASVPEGSRIVLSDELWNPLSDLFSGRMTAIQYCEHMDGIYQAIADGQ